MPTASPACAAAARRSATGRAPAARVAISSHPPIQDPGSHRFPA
jgi:hypothetical protein